MEEANNHTMGYLNRMKRSAESSIKSSDIDSIREIKKAFDRICMIEIDNTDNKETIKAIRKLKYFPAI